MFVNGTCLGKPWKKGFLCPGKPWNLVFASPGKSWTKSILMSVQTVESEVL